MQILHLFVSRAWYAFVPFSQRATNLQLGKVIKLNSSTRVYESHAKSFRMFIRNNVSAN